MIQNESSFSARVHMIYRFALASNASVNGSEIVAIGRLPGSRVSEEHTRFDGKVTSQLGDLTAVELALAVASGCS